MELQRHYRAANPGLRRYAKALTALTALYCAGCFLYHAARCLRRFAAARRLCDIGTCLPVPGSQLLAGYSNGELVKNHTLNVWRTHDGVDLAAEKGTAVTAAEAGTVAEVVMDPLWSGTVAIDHRDGTRTVYCGVAPEKALKAGDRVTAGQVLGSVDTVTAEVAMESHLHFAAKKDGKYIDPMTLPGLK